jgi:hypothetical protein
MTLPNTRSPKIEPEERLYRTPDRGLAAALHALGFSLMGVEGSPGGPVVFAFRWRPDLDGAVGSYWTDQLAVHPRVLIRSLEAIQLMAETWAREGDRVDAS